MICTQSNSIASYTLTTAYSAKINAILLKENWTDSYEHTVDQTDSHLEKKKKRKTDKFHYQMNRTIVKISFKLTITVLVTNINVVVLQPCTFLWVFNTLEFSNKGGLATLIVSWKRKQEINLTHTDCDFGFKFKQTLAKN